MSVVGTALDDLPLPPEFPTDPQDPYDRVRAIARGIVLAMLAGFVLLGAIDAWNVYADGASLTRALSEGISPNGPIPALPRQLEDEVRVLGLDRAVRLRHAQLAAATNSYRIGVEVEHRILGVALRTPVIREGPFDVAAQLPTLDVFVKAGWSLDPAARKLLDQYRASRGY